MRFDLKRAHQRHAVHRRRPERCSRASGRWARRQAQALRRDRQRVPDHQRARTRSARPIPAAGSSSSATPTTGRATCGVRRGMFNWDRVVYRYYKDQAVAREAFKAGEFDICKEYSGRSLGAPAQGRRSGTTAASQEGPVRDLGRPGPAGLHAEHAPAAVPGHPRARGAGLHLRLRHRQPAGLYKRANSQFNNSEFAAQGLPSPGELKLLEPFRAELPPAVFGPAFRAPTHRPRPEARCARTC